MSDFAQFYTSTTIQPRYRISHIIATMFIMDKQDNGIGRYRLEKQIGLGSGSIKSLFEQLRRLKLIERASEGTTQRGHTLSEKGKAFLKKIKNRLLFLKKGEDFLGERGEKISLGKECFIIGVKGGGDAVKNGIAVRDAAIKVGGTGATCLIFQDGQLLFPGGEIIPSDQYSQSVPYLLNLVQEHALTGEDVLVLGSGSSKSLARIAAVEAATALFPEEFQQ